MSTSVPPIDLTWLPPSLRQVVPVAAPVALRPGVIDFAALHARALPHLRTLLAAWLPNGTVNGQEFQVGSKAGEPGRSLSINLTTGRWADFAEPDACGGDVVSLLAYLTGLSQSAAAARLRHELELSHVADPVTR